MLRTTLRSREQQDSELAATVKVSRSPDRGGSAIAITSDLSSVIIPGRTSSAFPQRNSVLVTPAHNRLHHHNTHMHSLHLTIETSIFTGILNCLLAHLNTDNPGHGEALWREDIQHARTLMTATMTQLYLSEAQPYGTSTTAYVYSREGDALVLKGNVI